ncbi:MAG: polymer-forming cytoskeletal protein [Caldilineaceae bacterium]|nr:polymer-forming cytoskeletal protein [Caldilineaceae bacterium]
MFGRGQRPEPDAIEVIIGPRASFNGHLRCDASIRIDGLIEGGYVETPANVILTENARVQCDIVAKTVSIRGIYRGNLRADRVELLDGSQIYGTMNVNSFYMDEGVLMNAELNIQGMLPGEPSVPSPRKERTGNVPILPAQLRSPKSA